MSIGRLWRREIDWLRFPVDIGMVLSLLLAVMEDDFDMESAGEKRALLEAARIEFAQFYHTATVTDACLMDALVLVHVALTTGILVPRDGFHASLRDALESTCDKTERAFTELRERVRTCPTFIALFAAERWHIERVVFQVKVPC